MATKIVSQRCILVMVARGFYEVSTIHLISNLREAGLCVKTLGITGGLVSSRFGIHLMPDLTFSDLEDLARTGMVGMVILPETRQSLTLLEDDPRLHSFLRQIIAQNGQIVVNVEGRKFLKKISVGDPGIIRSSNGFEPLLLPRGQGQSVDELTSEIIYRMGIHVPSQV